MYSIVLAAIVTAGSATPAWGWHKGCHGCWGGCHGCWGASCHGCYGCGGCWGYSTSCYGCWGGYSSCYGCYGCGGCWGASYVSYGCYGCSGCWGGCYGCWGGYAPVMMAPGAPAAETAPRPKDVTDAPGQPKKETNLGNKAQVIVQAPADAKLIVDGRTIRVNSDSEPLLTPDLQPGRDYYYIVQAQAVRDGAVVEEARRLIVRAGHSSRVDFDFSNTVAKAGKQAQPARITVTLPEDATLYVDGKARDSKAGRQVFETPKLEPGKSYYYEFKAEVNRDGKSRSEDQRVVVEAGKNVVVDFLGLSEETTATTASRK